MKVVVLDDAHAAGLGHVSSVIGKYVKMSADLNATLHLPKPCRLLHRKHNDNVTIDCDHGWSLYLRLPKHVSEEVPPVSSLVTRHAASLDEDYETIRKMHAFVWKISLYTFSGMRFFKQFSYPMRYAPSRLPIVSALSSQKPYLSVRIRRGDDKCDRAPCKMSSAGTPTCPTSPADIACWWKGHNISRSERMFLFTDERDPRYVDQLRAHHNFTWIDPLLRNGSRNNYEVFVGVNEIIAGSYRSLLRHRSSCEKLPSLC